MKKFPQAVQALRDTILRRQLISPQLLDQIDAEVPDSLTISLLQNVHSDVLHYLDLTQRDRVNQVLSSPLRKAAGGAEAAKLKAKRSWDNPQSPEDLEESLAQVRKFVALYRQFDGKNQNDRNAMIEYLKQHHLLITLPNLIAAFEHLVLSGTLTLLPEQINAAWESEVTGYKLQHHPHLSELLAQHPVVDNVTAEQRAIEKMSADNYKKKYLQSEDTLPPLIAKRIESDVNSFMRAHPELQSSAKTKEILMDCIESEGLVVSYNSLQAAYAERKQQLTDAGCISSEGASIPVHYGASTLVDHRVAKPPMPTAPVEIRELPKRWTRQQILDMSSEQYSEAMQRYGSEFERAVDEAF